MFFLSKIARWHPIRPILAASIISIRRCRTKSNVNGIDSPSWILLANESLPLPLTDAIFKNSSRNDASRNLHGSVIDVDIFVHPRSTKKVYTYWIFFNISLVNFDIIKARNIGDKVLWGEGRVEVWYSYISQRFSR